MLKLKVIFLVFPLITMVPINGCSQISIEQGHPDYAILKSYLDSVEETMPYNTNIIVRDTILSYSDRKDTLAVYKFFVLSSSPMIFGYYILNSEFNFFDCYRNHCFINQIAALHNKSEYLVGLYLIRGYMDVLISGVKNARAMKEE